LILSAPEIQTACICLRARCRHWRRAEAVNAALRSEYEQLNALTADDLDWLRDMGWRR
jgi:hypothetical protein